MRQIDNLSVTLRLWPEVCVVLLFQPLQRDEKPQYLTKGALHLFSTTTKTTEKKQHINVFCPVFILAISLTAEISII